MTLEVGLTLLIVLGAVGLLLTRGRGKGHRPPGGAPPAALHGVEAERYWRAQLMAVTGGNRGAIERGEKRLRARFPRAPQAEVLRRLHEEYLRDRQ